MQLRSSTFLFGYFKTLNVGMAGSHRSALDPSHLITLLYSQGCAFIQFSDSKSAEKAIKQLHGKVGVPA